MKHVLLISLVIFNLFSITTNAEIRTEAAIIDPLSGADELIDVGVNAEDIRSESNSDLVIAVAPPVQQSEDGVAFDSVADFSHDNAINNDIQPVKHQVVVANIPAPNPISPGSKLEIENTHMAGKMRAYSFDLGGEDIVSKADVLRGNSTVLEPSLIMLFVLGLLGLGLIRRQKAVNK